MSTAAWLLLMLAAVVTTGCVCYLLGRRDSSQQREIDRLEAELSQEREQAERLRAGVGSHFERSAVLFGSLARDYRAFLDHFSASARELGLSQGRTEELLEEVARPLLAHRRGQSDGSAAGGHGEAGNEAPSRESADAAAARHDTAGADGESPRQRGGSAAPASGEGSGQRGDGGSANSGDDAAARAPGASAAPAGAAKAEPGRANGSADPPRPD